MLGVDEATLPLACGPCGRRFIEVLNLRPAVKKAIVFLLHRTHIKDALAHLGPYHTTMSARDSDPGGKNTVLFPAITQI